MKTKTGIIMDINKSKVTLMTQSGQFIDVKRNKSILEIGSIYTGEIYTKLPLRKFIATAAVFVFFIFASVEAYAYYTPTSTFIIGGAADIEIKINKWNKIISVNGLNNEGKEILEETHVKHSSIDNGLEKILKTTKKSFENRVNNKDLTLTIKEHSEYSNEENLKSKIDLADLPINIEVVTSHTEENTQNKNFENNNCKNPNSKPNNDELDYLDKENENSKNNANNKDSNKNHKSRDHKDALNNNSKNSNSELNKDEVDYSNKENKNMKNNTNKKESNNSNSKRDKDKLDYSDKENDNIKNNTTKKESDKSNNNYKSHDDEDDD